jgi:alpha-ribazole phosphatase/probable phosphoglycerate mutase
MAAVLTTLDFLRHGEPVGGKRYRGQTDDPLSEKGWAQMARATAGERPWNAIISSPLSRCLAFTTRMADETGLPLTVEPRLAEVGFGVWEGRTAAELDREEPGCVFAFKLDPVARRPRDAEDLADFQARVAAAYEDLLCLHAGRHVLLVAHAGVMRMVICHVLGLPPAHAYRLQIGSAAMARIRVEQGEGGRFDSLLWLTPGA